MNAATETTTTARETLTIVVSDEVRGTTTTVTLDIPADLTAEHRADLTFFVESYHLSDGLLVGHDARRFMLPREIAGEALADCGSFERACGHLIEAARVNESDSDRACSANEARNTERAACLLLNMRSR